jgi:hypothetical protein
MTSRRWMLGRVGQVVRLGRTTGMLACAALAAASLAYLHDPPWVEHVTTGLRDWEEQPAGTRYRWTNGHASFFVPADATTLTVPLRAVFPGPNGGPVTVKVSVDDRWLADVVLADPDAWVRPQLPLPRKSVHRRFRRIDLRVDRVVPSWNRGVQTGEITVERP